MRRLLPGLLAVVALAGCATAHLAGPGPQGPPDPGTPRTVVLEPFFEAAPWLTTERTEYVQVQPGALDGSAGLGATGAGLGLGYGTGSGVGTSATSMGAPSTVAVRRPMAEKPLFAQAPVLGELHQRVLPAVQRLRPSWRVTSTSGAGLASGPVNVVRTVVTGNPVVASNRAARNLAAGFGLLLFPLWFLAAQPVEETVRVTGTLERYGLDARDVASRLVRYPSQPDAAVNLAGQPALRREFGLELSYEEGLLAPEGPRAAVLVEGFVERLAHAIVALVEEPGGAETPAALPPVSP